MALSCSLSVHRLSTPAFFSWGLRKKSIWRDCCMRRYFKQQSICSSSLELLFQIHVISQGSFTQCVSWCHSSQTSTPFLCSLRQRVRSTEWSSVKLVLLPRPQTVTPSSKFAQESYFSPVQSSSEPNQVGFVPHQELFMLLVYLNHISVPKIKPCG